MSDLGRWELEPFTYDDVGATRGTPPASAHVVRAERLVGHGESDFHTISDAVLRYGMQRGAGLQVHASTTSAQVDTIIKLRVIGRQQQLLRIDFEKPPGAATLEAKLAAVRDAVPLVPPGAIRALGERPATAQGLVAVARSTPILIQIIARATRIAQASA